MHTRNLVILCNQEEGAADNRLFANHPQCVLSPTFKRSSNDIEVHGSMSFGRPGNIQTDPESNTKLLQAIAKKEQNERLESKHDLDKSVPLECIINLKFPK